MTIWEIVDRIGKGNKITLPELQRLERRLGKLRVQMQRIENAMKDCYLPKKQTREPNPDKIAL
jgi:hypothetical protein